MTWDWQYVQDILPALLAGTGLTIIVTAMSSAIALAGGLLLAVLYAESPRPIRWILRILIEVVRGVPILVMLYFGFYVFPHLGLTLSALAIGVCVLGVVYAAYCSEVYRGGLNAIPEPIRDASFALGLSRLTTWRRVLLPMAIKSTLPALLNYVLLLFKQSSFLFAIGVPVLLSEAQIAGNQTFRYLEPYTVAALLYLLLNLPFVVLLNRYEARHAKA